MTEAHKPWTDQRIDELAVKLAAQWVDRESIRGNCADDIFQKFRMMRDDYESQLAAANQRAEDAEKERDYWRNEAQAASAKWATGKQVETWAETDVLEARVKKLEAQLAAQWAPLPNGYNTGRMGNYEIQIGLDSGKLYIFNIRKNRECWTIDLPPEYAICRQAQEQGGSSE